MDTAPSVQAVVDRVSQAHNQTFQLDMENMGLSVSVQASYLNVVGELTGPVATTTLRVWPVCWRPPGS